MRPRWLTLSVISLAAAAFVGILTPSLRPLPAGAPAPGLGLPFSRGDNPHPVQLVRPPAAPLSAMAQLGRLIFFDPSLSSSGRLACASCHSPQRAYGPPNAAPAMAGGFSLARQGVRAVPSLMYLERQPNFSIGPDDQENEAVNLTQLAALSQQAPRAVKTAGNS